MGCGKFLLLQCLWKWGNRKLVCMQEDGAVKLRSRFFEVNGICEEMDERYTSVFENEFQWKVE